jgi:hypothetical protein
MASALPKFDEFTFAGQQRTSKFGYPSDHLFPLALVARQDWSPTLEEAVSHLSKLSRSGSLFDLLHRHGGAIVFRGLPISSPDSYSRLAHAFGFTPHEEVGRPPIRTILAPNVKTANEGPPELPIWPHNEYGWSTHNPSWLTFLCLEVPEHGGATPLINSVGLAHRLEQVTPVFFAKLLEKGVKYVYRYGREQVQSNTGASVFAAYGELVQDGDDEATIKTKIEEAVRKHSKSFEWHEDGSLSVEHVVPSSLPYFQRLSCYGSANHAQSSANTSPPVRRPGSVI